MKSILDKYSAGGVQMTRVINITQPCPMLLFEGVLQSQEFYRSLYKICILSVYLVFSWDLIGWNLNSFFAGWEGLYSETPICACHPLMNPSTLRHTAVNVNPPGFRGCSTLVAASLKNDEELLQVTSIFCDEGKKNQSLAMNRMSQPPEWKVTCAVASQSLYTHKWSPGEFKETRNVFWNSNPSKLCHATLSLR